MYSAVENVDYSLVFVFAFDGREEICAYGFFVRRRKIACGDPSEMLRDLRLDNLARRNERRLLRRSRVDGEYPGIS